MNFHRKRNRGWRGRASLSPGGQVGFVLLHMFAAALLAPPMAMPAGWPRHGVAAARGGRQQWLTVDH